MKATELKKVLETLIEKHGDTKIIISVHDYFTVHGCDAEININTDGCIWSGIVTYAGTTRLGVHLQDRQFPYEDNKHPKITFRK